MEPSRSLPDLRLPALCVAGAAMPWSKAGLSIGMGLLVLASLLHRRPVGTFRSPVGWSTLGLLVALLISALRSDDLARGWSEWTSLWPLLFLFLGAATIRDAPRPERFLQVVLASTVLASVQGWAYLATELPTHGKLTKSFEAGTNIWLYTLAMASGAIIALVLLLRARSARGRWLAGLGLIATLVAVVATRRRLLILLTGGILATVAALRRLPGRPWRALGLVCAAVLVLGLAAAAVDPRLRKITDWQQAIRWEQSRLLMWQFGWDCYLEHPVFGMGMGDFRAALHAHADQVEAETAAANAERRSFERVFLNLHHAQAHSNFVHTLAVAGTVGFLALLVWLLTLPAVLARAWPAAGDPVLIGLAAWGLLFFGGVTDASLYSSSRLATFTLLYAYAWGSVLRRPS